MSRFLAPLFMFALSLLACNSPKVSVANSTNEPGNIPSEVLDFRSDLNEAYLNPVSSILSEEQRTRLKAMRGHPFFPYDPDFRVQAKLKTFRENEIITLPTSSGEDREYTVYGVLIFKIKGQRLRLKVYRSRSLMATPAYADYLFLPFKDATAGQETYGGGRYLDLRIPADGSNELTLDFNQAYQPYCAYAYGYSCPIPPAENHLDLPIRAGVMQADLGEE